VIWTKLGDWLEWCGRWLKRRLHFPPDPDQILRRNERDRRKSYQELKKQRKKQRSKRK
jgi:hypothetical protein